MKPPKFEPRRHKDTKRSRRLATDLSGCDSWGLHSVVQQKQTHWQDARATGKDAASPASCRIALALLLFLVAFFVAWCLCGFPPGALKEGAQLIEAERLGAGFFIESEFGDDGWVVSPLLQAAAEGFAAGHEQLLHELRKSPCVGDVA